MTNNSMHSLQNTNYPVRTLYFVFDELCPTDLGHISLRYCITVTVTSVELNLFNFYEVKRTS